jgi:hypothetical protein
MANKKRPSPGMVSGYELLCSCGAWFLVRPASMIRVIVDPEDPRETIALCRQCGEAMDEREGER